MLESSRQLFALFSTNHDGIYFKKSIIKTIGNLKGLSGVNHQKYTKGVTVRWLHKNHSMRDRANRKEVEDTPNEGL